MNTVHVISIVPYKILPARLGGEKGIAVFNEYIGKEVSITAIGTKNNVASEAKNYSFHPILSNSRLRYMNLFLYFTVRKFIKEQNATHLLIEHPYFGWLAWMIKKTMKITWVVHSHNIEFERSKSIGRWWWKALKWYECWVYRQSDINFFISEDDREYAIKELFINPDKSYAITYGVEIPSIPTDKEECRNRILQQYKIDPGTKLLLFNGALYHHTNYDALKVILDHVNPVLLKQPIPYKIMVCGKGLPASFDELKAYKHQNIIYAGFVEDISLYFKAADIFLNPIISGGGVKTKAIEAIAYDCMVVSTKIGALGIIESVCGDQLTVVPNEDWKTFNEESEKVLTQNSHTPKSFYNYYYWGSIAKKVATLLKRLSPAEAREKS